MVRRRAAVRKRRWARGGPGRDAASSSADSSWSRARWHASAFDPRMTASALTRERAGTAPWYSSSGRRHRADFPYPGPYAPGDSRSPLLGHTFEARDTPPRYREGTTRGGRAVLRQTDQAVRGPSAAGWQGRVPRRPPAAGDAPRGVRAQPVRPRRDPRRARRCGPGARRGRRLHGRRLRPEADPDGHPPPRLPPVQPAAARARARSGSSASRSRWWWPRRATRPRTAPPPSPPSWTWSRSTSCRAPRPPWLADAPILHESLGDNLAAAFEVSVGDVEAAFAQAAHVVQGHFTVQRYTGMPIETRGVMATVEPISGRYLVWSSTQWPHTVRTALARVAGRAGAQDPGDRAGPGRRLRGEAGHLPRGDGDPAGGRAARAAGPLDRDPPRALRLHGPLPRAGPRGRAGAGRGRRGARAARAGHRRPGRLHARARRALPLDHGRVAAGAVPDQALPGDGPLRADQQGPGRGVSRGRRSGGRLRAGARRWTRRPASLGSTRPRSAAAASSARTSSPGRPASARRRCRSPTTAASTRPAWTGRSPWRTTPGWRAKQAAARAEGRYLGIGVASYVLLGGLGPYESAEVRVDPSGEVVVMTGAHAHGQGTDTALAQIVADELQTVPERVTVHHGDTDQIPFGVGTYASRNAVMAGSAVAVAARQVRAKALKLAAHLLEVTEDDLELRDGAFQVRGAPEQAADARGAGGGGGAAPSAAGGDGAGPVRPPLLPGPAADVRQRHPDRRRRGGRGDRRRLDPGLRLGERRRPADQPDRGGRPDPGRDRPGARAAR